MVADRRHRLGRRLAEVEETTSRWCQAITRFQRVVICVADDDVETYAECACAQPRGHGARALRQRAYDDTWLRDSGPITLRAPATAFAQRFLGSPAGAASSRPATMTAWSNACRRRVFGGAERQRIDFALEGGGIETDGAGTLLTTWHCLRCAPGQAPRRNRGGGGRWTLRPGSRAVAGPRRAGGDDTDAHIDTLARFAPGDAIVFQACDDPRGIRTTPTCRQWRRDRRIAHPDGAPYRLFPLPWPKPIDDGRRLATSYANYLIINDAGADAAYGDARDASAARWLAQAFPGRERQVPCTVAVR